MLAALVSVNICSLFIRVEGVIDMEVGWKKVGFPLKNFLPFFWCIGCEIHVCMEQCRHRLHCSRKSLPGFLLLSFLDSCQNTPPTNRLADLQNTISFGPVLWATGLSGELARYCRLPELQTTPALSLGLSRKRHSHQSYLRQQAP